MTDRSGVVGDGWCGVARYRPVAEPWDPTVVFRQPVRTAAMQRKDAAFKRAQQQRQRRYKALAEIKSETKAETLQFARMLHEMHHPRDVKAAIAEQGRADPLYVVICSRFLYFLFAALLPPSSLC